MMRTQALHEKLTSSQKIIIIKKAHLHIILTMWLQGKGLWGRMGLGDVFDLTSTKLG